MHDTAAAHEVRQVAIRVSERSIHKANLVGDFEVAEITIVAVLGGRHTMVSPGRVQMAANIKSARAVANITILMHVETVLGAINLFKGLDRRIHGERALLG
eukprot:Rmarinus@m.14239